MADETKVEVVEVKPEVNGDPKTGWRMSPSIGKLVEALCKAQLEFAPVVKANVNPQFKSKYADLASIISATMPSLAKHGLVVVQSPNTRGRDLILTTLLAHTSGEWIANDLTMPATMRSDFTAQTIGSATTYSRRYALQAILGVSADLDDDGTEASGGGSRDAAKAVGDEKVAELRDKAKKPGKTPTEAVPALFFTWHDESQTAEITGPEELKVANRHLLKPLWDANAKAIVANADQLEALKYEFAQKGVLFSALKASGAS